MKIIITTFYKDGDIETTEYSNYGKARRAADYRKSWDCVDSVTLKAGKRKGFVV